jgi:hypothetical protein
MNPRHEIVRDTRFVNPLRDRAMIRLAGIEPITHSTDAGERYFRRSAHQGGIAERKAMIDREHELPITRQAGA